MKKLITVCLMLVVLLLVGMTSVAVAGKRVTAQKTNLYHVSGGSSNNVLLNQPYDGHVTIVDPMGANDIILNGVIKGLLPNTEYFVWVRNLLGYTGEYLYSYPPLGYYKLTSFMTDEEGNGNFHYRINGNDLPDGTYMIQVAINYAPGHPIGYTVAATQWSPGLTVTVKTAE